MELKSVSLGSQNMPLDTILSQFHPVHIFRIYFCKRSFDIIFPSIRASSK
jgi:hypothetical protein